MNRPSRFKQADLTKALKGALAAGVACHRVEIDQAGKIVIFALGPKSDDLSDYDSWKAQAGAAP